MRRLIAIVCGLMACAVLANEQPRARGFVMPKIRKAHYRGAGAKKPLMLMAEPLPSFYDARSNGWVTAVKNQGGYGTCWAFGACGALESAILKAGLTNAVDLSEKNLVNLWGLAGSHGIHGGDSFSPIGYLTRWQGAVMESEDRYPTSGSSEAAFGSSPQILPSYYVRKAILLPERMSVTDNDFMKRALLKYGALFVNYYSGYEKGATSCITWGSYWGSANHAVTLVGWDDDFVIDGHKGAFIVKGSWGSWSGDNGYYRIAYDDVTFCTGLGAAAYDEVTATPFADTVYQYDRIGWQWVESDNYYSFDGTRIKGRGYNRYTAAGEQELVAVGIVATVEDARYAVTIRLARGGAVLHTQSGTLAEMGYHVLDLTKPVSLAAGTRFEVEIDMDIPFVEYKPSVAYSYPLAMELHSSVSNPIWGESYAHNGGRYVRVQDAEAGNLVIKAFARSVRTPRKRFVRGGSESVSNGAEVVAWAADYVPTASFANTYGAFADMVCANGRALTDNWFLGLDPADATSEVTANLSFTNGCPCVTASPLTDRCAYAVEGRESLSGGGWARALFDGTHRFFRVMVSPK